MSAAADAPFFVIGSPRSGTTLLRLMLTSHPALVVPPECGFAAWLHPQFAEWDGGTEQCGRFVAAVAASRKFDTWGLDADALAAAFAADPPRSYAAACDRVYRAYCLAAGKPAARWGDKNNFYLEHVARLRAIFPGARFIHQVRDGRDVACSYREVMAMGSASPYRPELPTGIADIARLWAGNVRTIAHQLETIPPGDRFQVRYEDLVADPAATLAPLCAWLGVDFDVAMLRFHEANRELGLEPAATMDWKRRTTEPASAATVGRHRALLDAAEIGIFEDVAGAELRRFGYLA
jgi:LPS sulfotransferase NodH